MTVVVSHEGYPDRVACGLCRCEIGIASQPDVVFRRLDRPGFRATELDEPKVRYNAECPCRCHEAARIIMRVPFWEGRKQP